MAAEGFTMDLNWRPNFSLTPKREGLSLGDQFNFPATKSSFRARSDEHTWS